MSLNAAQQNTTETVVDALVSNGTLFTAYNVTLAVRQLLGPTQNVHHKEVRDAVHDIYNSGGMPGYRVQQSTTVPGNPFVFLPRTADVSLYTSSVNGAVGGGANTVTVNNGQVSFSPGTLSLSSPSVPKSVTVPSPTVQSGSIHTDSLNRIRIGKSLIASINVKPYDLAYVNVDPTSRKVFVSKSRTGNQDVPMYVDKYQNLRVALTKRGLNAPNGFNTMSNTNDVLELQAV